MVFWCKNLDNIISGPQRTVQNEEKAVHDPFNSVYWKDQGSESALASRVQNQACVQGLV